MPAPEETRPSEKRPEVAPPNTTAEENRRTGGQRRINLIWEITQAVVALAVTGCTLYTAVTLTMRPATQGEAQALLLSNAFFLVIGFYFGRTNHQRIGGVGGGEGGR